MFRIFNPDMTQRIADLWSAVSSHEQVEVCSLEPFEHLPARILVTFGPRKFVLDHEMANQVADQFAASGFPVFGSRLRPEPGAV